MRLSIKQGAAGYQPPHVCANAIVTLDGVVQRTCIFADEEKGMIKRYKTAAQRQTEYVRGTVVIAWKEGYTPPLHTNRVAFIVVDELVDVPTSALQS